jgi:hypothetical protein
MLTSQPQRRATDRPRRVHVLTVIACLAIVVAGAYLGGVATGPSVVAAMEEQREQDTRPVPRALPEGITKFHDATEEVTCWRTNRSNSSIACLPDQWLATARASE